MWMQISEAQTSRMVHEGMPVMMSPRPSQSSYKFYEGICDKPFHCPLLYVAERTMRFELGHWKLNGSDT